MTDLKAVFARLRDRTYIFETDELDALVEIAEDAVAWYERRVVRDDDEQRGRHALITRQYEEGGLFSSVDAFVRLYDAQQGERSE